MTTEELRDRFADILEEDDGADVLDAVRDLEAAFSLLQPPAAFYRAIASDLERQAGKRASPGSAASPRRLGLWNRKTIFATVLLVASAIGFGRSGLATAAVDRATRLFASPPPTSHPAVWVGSLDIPLWGGCAPHQTTWPVTVPNGRPVAQLESVPAGFDRSVWVTLTPCFPQKPPKGAVTPVPQPTNLAWENIEVLSVVRYRGRDESVQVLTARASAEGMRRGLYLGNPAGHLADGSPAFTLMHDIRWLKEGLIVDVSGNGSLERLKSVANDVVIR